MIEHRNLEPEVNQSEQVKLGEIRNTSVEFSSSFSVRPNLDSMAPTILSNTYMKHILLKDNHQGAVVKYFIRIIIAARRS
jgi:hypothetical protein